MKRKLNEVVHRHVETGYIIVASSVGPRGAVYGYSVRETERSPDLFEAFTLPQCLAWCDGVAWERTS